MLGLLAACVLALALVGCGTGPDRSGDAKSPFAPPEPIGEPTAAERDSAIALLSSMQRAVFDSAFTRLRDAAFTRTIRTEEIDASGSVIAQSEQTVRFSAGDETGTVVEQSGAADPFSQGSLDALLPSSRPEDRPVNLASQAFPDKPAYLSPRTREAFRYRVRSGGYEGEPAQVVTVQAREDGMGRDQSVRYAELTILRDSRELVAAHAVRSEHVLLFEEDSRLTVRLRPAGDTWLPAETRFHARVKVPFRSPLRFRTTSTFSRVAL